MLMYFLLPHRVSATCRSLAQTSMRAEFPSGKQPTEYSDEGVQFKMAEVFNLAAVFRMSTFLRLPFTTHKNTKIVDGFLID